MKVVIFLWLVGGSLALGYAGYSAPPPNNGIGMMLAAVGMWWMGNAALAVMAGLR